MYKIIDWDVHFENSQSRRYSNVKWVAMPNKRGFGYTKILKQPNGEAIFGCWCAIVELASTCNPRGELQSNGVEYSIEDISDLTGYTKKTIQDTLNLCCNVLKWIKDTTTMSAVGAHYERTIPSPPDQGSILFNSILSNSLLSEAVEKIYNAYPRKKGKGQAVRAIRSAIKKIEPVLLLEAVHKYADSVAGQAPQYIPYPATWFNGERWLDEPEKSKDEQMIETAKKFMEEASNGTGAFYENNALPAKDV